MMPYVLDTDTFSLYLHGHAAVCQNVASHSSIDLATTVISVEEQLAGWYTSLRQAKQHQQLAFAYQKLAEVVHALGSWSILSFTVPAILRFEHLKTLKLGVRGNDLRIAAIILEHGGTLVTRNKRDFQRVPNLAFVDWSV
jgi:tRNA(fMet)-specific endonuclease VapC